MVLESHCPLVGLGTTGAIDINYHSEFGPCCPRNQLTPNQPPEPTETARSHSGENQLPAGLPQVPTSGCCLADCPESVMVQDRQPPDITSTGQQRGYVMCDRNLRVPTSTSAVWRNEIKVCYREIEGNGDRGTIKNKTPFII